MTGKNPVAGGLLRLTSKASRRGRIVARAFLLAVALVAAFHGQALPAESKRPSLITPRFELYAPDQKSLNSARGELEQAAARFGRFMGAEPPPIAVVIFATDDRARAFDSGPFARRNMAVLPWVMPPAGEATVEPARCRKIGGSSTAAEPAHVRLGHAAGRLFLREYVRRRVGAPLDGASAGAGLDAADPLGAIPDWFEEAVADLCEPDAVQAARRDLLRESMTRRIPLWSLFVMPRPGGAAPQAQGGSDLAALFSAESHSVAEFLAASLGPSYLGTLADSLILGRATTQALRESAAVSPDVDDLETDWLSWFVEKPASADLDRRRPPYPS
jgi:hypothetical protein